ncbi:DUF3899 domain-containing protein [Geobacillus thermocatenulatus]|uniref:DUF3899 domain-containing protein n=2 Tax=Geobacillus TaxID=129337 RepID=A0A226Q2T6_9BACL|nr:DUF3899 domain-containing protein [Geobacillus thermocatenulatus]AST00282.1 hypothetical protein GT3921_15365 [Geobacillus thermocatenulatus]KPC98416.1 hypothetical protein LR69_03376 [Geobacillus sp. BCO2]OXB86636.1 hypothetical protein B9L19_14060 [Geobacillus thermocatenulatus]RAN30003.1 hypothetical protein VC88_04280 [Geobacillus sp. A8]
MKQTAVRTGWLVAAMLAVSALIVIGQGAWTTVAFINVSFLLSLLPLSLGGLLFVYERGFFSGFAYGFRRLRRSSTKVERYLEEAAAEHESDEPLGPRRFAVTYPLLFSGLLLFLTMIAAGYAVQ